MSYIENISKQYQDATGVRTIDFSSKQFLDELESWTSERQKMGKIYIEILKHMGLSGFDSIYCAETNKGLLDTVVRDHSTTIITPYCELFQKEIDEERIVKGYMSIVSGLPVLFLDGIRGPEISGIDSYMTQNPYSPLHIQDWDKLHKSGSYNIIVGAYGKVYDKDKYQKEQMISELVERIDSSDIVYDYFEYEDDYYTVVGSERMILKKEKTMSGGRTF